MSVATFLQTAFTTQDPTTYKSSIDGNFSVLTRTAAMFAPHAQSSPNMTVKVDAGHIFSGTLLEVAAQSSGTITAPVTHDRIDRVVIDAISGTVSVVAGTENTSPVPPAIPAGKIPVAQVLLHTTTTTITNTLITDERDMKSLGNGFSPVDSQTGANYTYLSSDRTRVKIRSNSATAMSDTLPQAGTTFPAGWAMTVVNDDATATLTITPTTSTIDGAASTTIKAGRGAEIFSDGTNYYTNRGSHGALGPLTNIASATTCDFGAALSNYLNVTGSTAITSLGSTASAAFPFYVAKMAAGIVITQGTNLNVQGGVSYTTAANDYIFAFVRASGAWDVLISKADGTPVTPPQTYKKFTSSQQTITSAGTLTIAHGLSAVPNIVQLFLVNQTGEAGYTAGQITPANPALNADSSADGGVSIIVDATNITIRYGSDTNVFRITNATTGAVANLTNANWKAIFVVAVL